MSSALKEMGTNYSDIELDSGFEKRLDNLRLNPVPNPVDEAKEGPSDEDKEASKKLQSPSLLNRFFSSRLGRYLLALGGSAGSLSLAAACTPAPQQAEVRTVTQSRIETADMKSKIQVIHETSPDKSVETWKVVASNPSRNQQAEFMFINTIENGQKKSIVAFPKDGKNTSSDYRMANYTDSENQAHLVYLASNDSSFIDFRLDIGVPEKLDDQFTQKVFNASENIETINGVTITNLATGKQAIFEKEGNNDLFKELLQALTTKKAQAAELPATPTITPTATATKTPEPAPTPAIKSLTPDIKVLSNETVDTRIVDAKESQELYQKSADKGENKIPIPVELGENGIIEEYVLPNGVRGLVIKNLKVGETYTIVAHTDVKADGFSKEDNLQYAPNRTNVGVNFNPTNRNPNAKYTTIGYGFPLNASIRPKYFGPFDKKEDIEEFKAGQVLATFTVNPPDSPEQKEFEKLLDPEVGPGAVMVIGFMTPKGINKEPISLADVFLQDSQGHPVVLNSAPIK